LDNFYNPDIINGNLQLDEEESKHCIRVLRKKEGDLITVFDGQGGIYTCRLSNTYGKKAEYVVLEKQIAEQPTCSIHLAIAPTKNIERIEWLLEKSIEVGIQDISFIQCENSVRKRINMDRMIKKAVNAMKQSQNAFVPVINDIISFNDFIINAVTDSQKVICHADLGKEAFLIHTVVKGPAYLIIVGPEGDFTREEMALAEKQGFKPVSLGKSRLRTETAGLVACILLNALNTQD